MSAAPTHPILEGERRKAAALGLLAVRHESLVREGRRRFLNHLLEHGRGTIDDVRELVALPSGVNPKLFGAVPRELAKAGIIQAVGFARSRRPEAHARPVAIWELRDVAAAIRWLDDHPDLPSLNHLAGCMMRPVPPETRAPDAGTPGAR